MRNAYALDSFFFSLSYLFVWMRLGYYLFAAVLCIWFLAILCRYVFALCLSLSLSLSNEISSKKYAFANVLNHYGNIYYNILNGMALKLKFEYHKKVAYTQTEAYAKCSCPTDMTAPSQLQHDVCYGEVHIWPFASFDYYAVDTSTDLQGS